MSKEVPEVDVEKLASLILEHEIARVTISDAEDVSCNALASKRVEVVCMVGVKFSSECVVATRVGEAILHADVVEEVVDHALLVERAQKSLGVLLMHLGDDCSIVNKFNVACLESRLHHIIGDHRHVEAC